MELFTNPFKVTEEYLADTDLPEIFPADLGVPDIFPTLSDISKGFLTHS